MLASWSSQRSPDAGGETFGGTVESVKDKITQAWSRRRHCAGSSSGPSGGSPGTARCVRDYETLPSHHEAMVHIAMIMTVSRRLAQTGNQRRGRFAPPRGVKWVLGRGMALILRWGTALRAPSSTGGLRWRRWTAVVSNSATTGLSQRYFEAAITTVPRRPLRLIGRGHLPDDRGSRTPSSSQHGEQTT